MSLLPIFLKLDGRPGLLVGAGNVALEKIKALLTTGIRLRVIAPEAKAEIQQLAGEGKLAWIQRRFVPADLDGNFIAIAATDNAEVNATVYHKAVQRGILVNSVDDPPHCDFYFGSIVRRGDLQIAISTAGESPAVAQRLRREIDELLADDLGPWLKDLGQLRREILTEHPPGDDRKALLHRLAQREFFQSSANRSLIPLVRHRRATVRSRRGKVFLVGAGPGDPELLTVKALRLIQSADVILHDDLVPHPFSSFKARFRSGERGQALRNEEHHAGRDSCADDCACRRRPPRGAAEERRPADLWACGGRNSSAD